jgi:hypothetical protein
VKGFDIGAWITRLSMNCETKGKTHLLITGDGDLRLYNLNNNNKMYCFLYSSRLIQKFLLSRVQNCLISIVFDHLASLHNPNLAMSPNHL